jgi:hypothetical protein
MNHNGNGNGSGRAWSTNGDLECFDDSGSCFAFRRCIVPKANTGLPYLPIEVRIASIAINAALDALALHLPSDREIVILHTHRGPLLALAKRTHAGLVSDELMEIAESAPLEQQAMPAQKTPAKSAKRVGAKRHRGRY